MQQKKLDNKKAEKRHFLKIGQLAEFLTVLSNSLKYLKQ